MNRLAERAESSKEVVRQIKEVASIVDIVGEVVALSKSGAHFKGLCPFHQEKSPSFIVHPDRQFFHCFGCNESGDVFSFVMKHHRLGFREALEHLAARYHIPLPEKDISPAQRESQRRRQRLFAANAAAARIYHDFLRLSPEAGVARNYLEGRGIPWTVAEEFDLGFAPEPEGAAGWDFLARRLMAAGVDMGDAAAAGLVVARADGSFYDRFRNRVLCPIHDQGGRVAGFGGRILAGEGAKYLNSPESEVYQKGQLLFGLHVNRQAIAAARSALLVEGNFDLLGLAASGVRNVVAPLGTALTRPQIRLLKGLVDEIVLVFDGDAAGQKAALRAVALFFAEQMPGRVVILPEGEDPDSFVRGRGGETFAAALAAAVPLPEFVFGRLAETHGMTLDGKTKIMAELKPLIAACADAGQRALVVAHFSKKLGVPQDVLASGGQLFTPLVSARGPSQGGVTMQQRQILEFLVLRPEYFPAFHEAGVATLLDDPLSGALLQGLAALGQDGEVFSEELLAQLPEGEARRFVAQTLLAHAATEDLEGVAAATAAEILSWLGDAHGRRSRRTLLRQIEEAQAAGDTARLFVLLDQKRRLELPSSASPGVGND